MASSVPSRWILRRLQPAISSGASSTSFTVPVPDLELFLTKRLQVDGDFEEVEILTRHDAHYLKCTTMAAPHSIGTILGILEDDNNVEGNDNEAQTDRLSQLSVDITCYQASHLTSKDSMEESTTDETEAESADPQFIDCSRTHRGPHSDWIRHERPKLPDRRCDSTLSSSSSKLWWIDLRSARQPANNEADSLAIDDSSFLSTQEGVVNLFRSIFSPSHDVSPWATNAGATVDGNGVSTARTSSTSNQTNASPDLVLLAIDPNDTSLAALLEDVRVSDVAPSWFLHARVKLDSLEAPDKLGKALSSPAPLVQYDDHDPATLLIFKKLGPRTCLFEERPEDILTSTSNDGSDTAMAKGCLWESYVEQKDSNDGDDNAGSQMDAPSSSPQTPSYRLVCPPYVNLHQAYANTLIPELFTLESILTFTQDALSIPQWTPWPESVHYKTTSSGGDAMPWTVFPLCHCFPANDPENLTWVPATRAHVPNTCALLQELVGPRHLRTALFSQLAPHSVLEAHTGWADLANHVLRLHIPLVVPGEEEEKDLCGTWVDGCVETHTVGRPLLFDDSKIHRAFNYSNATRIVLIVDLARPEDLPPGYAEGGHTDELDAFIQQMSLPK